MSNFKIKKIKEELEIIRNGNKGILTPEAVVEYARSHKKSTLYKQFTWDNNIAAEKYRLSQAMLIIRKIKVEIVPNKNKNEIVKVRQYVSLPKDRNSENHGSYREITEVMSDDDLRISLIESVQSEFEAVRKKLSAISIVCEKYAEKISKEIQVEKSKILYKKSQNRKRA